MLTAAQREGNPEGRLTGNPPEKVAYPCAARDLSQGFQRFGQNLAAIHHQCLAGDISRRW
ncbi:hypothetical protein SAMN05444390_102412 [Marinobacterium lutimaris]|uniref:Uncharacterized protein n=1 Tax=Marinobacterium lutimaris TaxID=568106 RepID=A0A1H6B515_9GAMM|nr:hypothetical protein SAMN05444390_102412 [Marinobacterium lutimaris]